MTSQFIKVRSRIWEDASLDFKRSKERLINLSQIVGISRYDPTPYEDIEPEFITALETSDGSYYIVNKSFEEFEELLVPTLLSTAVSQRILTL